MLEKHGHDEKINVPHSTTSPENPSEDLFQIFVTFHQSVIELWSSE